MSSTERIAAKDCDETQRRGEKPPLRQPELVPIGNELRPKLPPFPPPKATFPPLSAQNFFKTQKSAFDNKAKILVTQDCAPLSILAVPLSETESQHWILSKAFALLPESVNAQNISYSPVRGRELWSYNG